MIFSSYSFILVFLPAFLAGFFLLGRWRGREGALAWALGMSLVFYAVWCWTNAVRLEAFAGGLGPGLLHLAVAFKDLWIIVGLTCFNYWMSRIQVRRREATGQGSTPWLVIALVANLGTLGFFKYADFLQSAACALVGRQLGPETVLGIALPLGISFYIFQKIGFVCDTWAGRIRDFTFREFLLFVIYFPQLIAGPIVHHSEIVPQFRTFDPRPRAADLAVGTSIFIFGLAKKVLIADNLAPCANQVFHDVHLLGHHPSAAEAWIATLSYTGQLYFDFSGYSDMAIGLARMVSFRLPMNFNSPYQACDIIEFWRRWHITLSRFLRDYIYIPLGGNRKGETRRYLNLFLTFLLGGLWHGAGWAYLAWGALHGLYTCICHGWKALRKRLGWTAPGRFAAVAGWAITLLAVMVSWVFFRAGAFTTYPPREGTVGPFTTGWRVLEGMAGCNGLGLGAVLPEKLKRLLGIAEGSLQGSPLVSSSDAFWAILAMAFAVLAPNTNRLMHWTKPVYDLGEVRPHRIAWRPTFAWALLLALLALLSLQSMTKVSYFLYFQF